MNSHLPPRDLRQRFVSDVSHALGQPLTELRCSLELALHKALDAEGYRSAIQQALRSIERLTAATKFARQLAEAEDPGDESKTVDLSNILREVSEEFEPVAEAYHLELGRSIADGMTIQADENHLRRALFLVFDHILHCAKSGTRVTVDARSSEDAHTIDFATHSQQLLWRNDEDLPFATPPDYMQRSLQLAERMVRTMHGYLIERHDAAGTTINLRLPCL